MNRWTDTEKAVAQAQGWDIFAIDGDQGRLEIQRIDEMEKFDGDAEALAHVYVAAAKGDLVCRAALEICHKNEVKHWTTYNDAHHRNNHAAVFDVEFFAFPYQSYNARVGNLAAIVSNLHPGWAANTRRCFPSGKSEAVAHAEFEHGDEAFIWAAEQLLKGETE